MILLIFYVVTLLSSLILGGWSVFLLKNFDKKNSKMIEGKKSLYVYLIFSIMGMVLSGVLIVTTFL